MDSKARLTRLTVEYLEQPLGIDTAQPRFGWQMEAPRKPRLLPDSLPNCSFKPEAGGSLGFRKNCRRDFGWDSL